MKQAIISAVITIIAIQLFGIVSVGWKEYLQAWGALNFWGAGLSLIIGIILVFFKSTREYAKGILISSGIFLVIGFATCTATL